MTDVESIEEIIDVDLDAKDAQMREAAGKPTTLRLRGQVIHVNPPKLWGAKAMKAASDGDLGLWAELALDEDELKSLTGEGDDYEDLMLYELEAIFEAVANKNGMSGGKSGRSSNSSKKRRKR